MIEFNTLKFGDKVYIAEEKNNAFTKRKIKTVIDGVEWFRYDRDQWEYNTVVIEYCGKVTHIEEGDVRFDEERITEYHFRYPDGQIEEFGEGEDEEQHLEHWFYTKDEAEQYIQDLRESRE
jgi:hypothetical protein